MRVDSVLLGERHSSSTRSVQKIVASFGRVERRGEDLIVTDRRGSYVRSRDELIEVRAQRGRISARMPSEPERRELGLTEGVPLLVFAGADGSEQMHPIDHTVIVVHVVILPELPAGEPG